MVVLQNRFYAIHKEPYMNRKELGAVVDVSRQAMNTVEMGNLPLPFGRPVTFPSTLWHFHGSVVQLSKESIDI